MAAYQDPPPAYIYTPAPNSFTNPQQEEEIVCRESALEGETYLERLPGRTDRPKNFPPFPKSCSLKPCCYFSIKTEVPRSEQWKMYGLFALLIYIWVVYVINLVVAIIGAIVNDNKRGEYLTTMGVSILYLVLFIPCSLFCWFLPAYCAYSGANSRCRSLSIKLFFFIMMVQILGFLLNAIGIPNLGACGFFNGATFFNSVGGTKPSQGDIATGAMFLIVGFLWILGLPVAILLLIMICIYFLCGAGRSRLKRLSDAMEEEVLASTSNQ